jgi:hypothetical protein
MLRSEREAECGNIHRERTIKASMRTMVRTKTTIHAVACLIIFASAFSLSSCSGAALGASQGASGNTKLQSSATEQLVYVVSSSGAQWQQEKLLTFDSIPDSASFQQVGTGVSTVIQSPTGIFIHAPYRRLFLLNDNNFALNNEDNVAVFSLNVRSSPEFTNSQILLGLSINRLVFDQSGLFALVQTDVGDFETARFDSNSNSLQEINNGQRGGFVLIPPNQRLVICAFSC